MKYALIKNTFKIVSIKEIEIDKANLSITITSTSDEPYVEVYLTGEELLARLLSLNGGFNSTSIKEWF